MERSRIENVVSSWDGLSLDSPSSENHAASFANALDIILSTDKALIDYRTTRNLRLVCKATRSLVDFYVDKFRYLNSHNVQDDPSVCNLAPWPWPNVSLIKFFSKRRLNKEVLQRDAEYLATIPLLKLKCLSLQCISVLPLVDCNFPMLAELHLTILRPGNDLNLPTYPRDLRFPRWQKLKRLILAAEVNPSVCTSDSSTISFLGPLLKSGAELTEFKLGKGANCTEVVADMIVSAPLPHLETLDVTPNALPEFYITLFSRDWPALKRLYLRNGIKNGTLSLIASKSCVKQLEHVDISFEKCLDATAEGLHTFLKALENGVIEELELDCLNPLFLEAFKGINLKWMNFLDLSKMAVLRPSEEETVFDVSAFINLLFESCSFPELEMIVIGIHREFPCRWVTPPRTDSKDLIALLPKLKAIRLENLTLSQEVAHYLGNFRKQTGCTLVEDECIREFSARLSSEHQIALDNLDLNYEQWHEFCRDRVGSEAWKDLTWWNAMSIGRFKRTAFGAALVKSRNVAELASFIRLVEAEEKGTVMAADVLTMLKYFLNRRLLDATLLGVREHLTWEKVDTLIDLKEHPPLDAEHPLFSSANWQWMLIRLY